MNWTLIAFIALQLADILTTLEVLDRGGREVNPLLLKAFSYAGPAAALIVIKTAIIAIVCAAVSHDMLIHYALEIVCIAYAGVIINNIYHLFRLSKR